ncbi:MAG: efflux RND transporter periplasmic adaptor subunit [Pseudomonadota bacterium]|nr:efflux RND transporter periplasmic adaptor subunit [Pseudomonadota bacterium]
MAPSPWRNYGLSIMMVASLLTVFGGCGKKDDKAAGERIFNVRAVTVEKRALRPFVEAVGTLKANEEVIVSSELDGILKRITVTEGSQTTRGAMIAEINETDYRLEVKRAEAALRQTQASLANARLEFERKDALYKEQLVTRQQYDDVTARLAVAEGEVERAQAALALAREKLAKTRIHAPMSGSVKEKRATAGDYVRNGAPLVHLIQTQPLKLSFSIIEREVGRIGVGQDVRFTVDSFPGREFRGVLRNIYPHLEEKTRTLQAEAIVPNDGQLLKPGLFARATVFTGPAKDVVIVPITSLLYEGTNVKAFIVENGAAREKPLKTGQKYGEYMEVVEGLQGGEQLVVVGQNNLSSGVRVNVAR